MRLFPSGLPRFLVPAPAARARVLLSACLLAPAAVRATPTAPTAVPGTVRTTVAAADSSHHAEVALARAVVLWRAGELRAAADALADVDVSATATWPGADRAAFLLAVLERRLGRPQALRERLVGAGDAGSSSAYRRWLAHLELWDAAGATRDAVDPDAGAGAGALPVEPVLAASLLLEAGRATEAAYLLERAKPEAALAAMHHHLLSLALQEAGRDPTPAWRRLADLGDTSGAAGKLVATARLQLARAASARGEDARGLLERVVADHRPETSGDDALREPVARAGVALALTALAGGDTLAARGRLDEALAAAPAGTTRRHALLERGALSSASGDQEAAARDYDAADSDWQHERGRLGRWLEAGQAAAVDSAWAAWTAQDDWGLELRPDAGVVAAALSALAEASLDLRGQPAADPARGLAAAARDGAAAAAGGAGGARGAPRDELALAHRPNAAEMDAWYRQRDALARAEAQRDESRWRADALRRELGHRLDFLDRGRQLTRAEVDSLARLGAWHDRLQPEVARALALLRRLHDDVLADVLARAAAMQVEARRNAIYAQAIAHFHVDGPGGRQRPEAVVMAAGELMAREDELAARLDEFAGSLAAGAPGLMQRSLVEAWEPRLRDADARVRDALARHGALASSLEVELAGLADRAQADPRPVAAGAELAAAAGRVAALADSLRALRLRVAAAVASRGLAAMAVEREGIDYHLADAAYWRAVGLATDPDTAERAGLVAPSREMAMARLDTFLHRYPHSAVRGEARFRLADLELFRARDAFEARLAGYLDGGATDAGATRALAPLFEGGVAAGLYESILREDPDFAHRDAVLFNLGMLKVDGGDPAGLELLAQLVREHPDAAGAQQAWLRLGDDRFEARDHAGCLAPYEQAASGSDASLAAIALYRLGWARFAIDDFEASAAAFARLLDLAAADVGDGDAAADASRGARASRLRGPASLREEAQDHLVQALLRAGGAEAFTRQVERAGARPWDERTLAAMATQAGRYSLDDDAIACDRLWLERYGDAAGALPAAERLAGSLERAGRAREAVTARLEQASRFLPGSAWRAAHDSVGTGGRADLFARRALEGAAVLEHREARAGSDTTAWTRALAHYESFLSHWPAVAESPRLAYQAGEAARELSDYPRALAHFEAAARSDTAAFAPDAAWQAVAVRDAWYRGTLGPGRAAGDDSLAAALLRAGDAFLARLPGDSRAAELAWRQGQVAYAHGWNLEAARRLLDFAADHEKDPHAPDAARLAGDALYREGDLVRAGSAYGRAGSLADLAGRSEMAAEMAALQPRCAYEHAAAVAAAGDVATAAPLYLDVATRWPDGEHASAALYQAGLGFAAAGRDTAAIAAWETIVAANARGALGRDAAVRIAETHEKAGRATAAAAAWVRLADLDPQGVDAPAALLRAVDLREAAGDTVGAESLRDVYLGRFPGDLATAFAVAGDRARRELSGALRDGQRVTSLAAPVASSPKGGRKAAPATAVRRYLDLAAAHPELGEPALLARIDYLCADEALRDYRALELTQPLPRSLEAKNRALEGVVARFSRCAERGDAELAHAAAHRIGEAIIHLGDALLASERPAELTGDDLAAYDEVLREQAWGFATRGEDAWRQLLRTADRSQGADPGGWLARTEHELWPRLARRYVHRPELEYPLAAAAAVPGQ